MTSTTQQSPHRERRNPAPTDARLLMSVPHTGAAAPSYLCPKGRQFVAARAPERSGVAQAGPLRISAIPDSRPTVIPISEAYQEHPEEEKFTQGTLALDFVPEDFGFERVRTTLHELPNVEQSVSHLAQTLVEVLAGLRPATQLIRHLSNPLYAAVTRRATASARRRTRGVTRRPLVRKVRLSQPADGVVEAAIVVQYPERIGAIAARLEGLDGRWMITALVTG